MNTGWIIIIVIFFLFFLSKIRKENLNKKLEKIKKFPEVTYIPEMTKNLIFDCLNLNKTVTISKEFQSESTKEKIGYDEILPIKMEKIEIKRVLILLHGIRDSKDDWRTKGKLIENYHYLLKKNSIEEMAFVIPESGYNGESWYTNFYHEKDFKYEDYFIKELFPQIKKEFPNAKFGIVGFSMGGYGAFKLGIRSCMFEVVGSISGAVSLIRMISNKRVLIFFKYIQVPKILFENFEKKHFVRVFSSKGRKILKEDVYSIFKKLKYDKYKNINFYASVGTEDKEPYLMFQQWLDIVGRMKKYRYKFKAYLYQNEIHTWEYVSKDLGNFLKYFYENTK